MYQGDIVLCTASRYVQKFYINPDFDSLPGQVKDELKAMCVLFTEEVGGIIILYFDENGSLNIKTEAEENDLLYDEIGSGLMVRRMINTKRELFEQLEQYYEAFF
jgi:hypothetical protein